MGANSRTITIWFSQRIPADLAEPLRRLATVQERSFTILEADRVDWRSGFEIVRKTPLWSSLLGVSLAQQQDFDWRQPPTGVVGAVLVAADVQRGANRPEEYEPKLPAPDMGFLPEGVPLEVLDEPKVDLSEVGEELVFSSKLARYLASQCGAEFGKVRHRGRFLERFNRLFLRSQGSVLSELSRGREVPCRVCGAPLLPSLGTWVAAADTPVFSKPVLLDTLDIGHLGAQHRIVVDNVTARVLDVTFGDGLELQPIHGASSEAARWVQTVLDAVRAPARA